MLPEKMKPGSGTHPAAGLSGNESRQKSLANRELDIFRNGARIAGDVFTLFELRRHEEGARRNNLAGRKELLKN